jgi:hypothetical protein
VNLRPLGRVALVGLAAWAAGGPGRAWGYDVLIDVRTIGQGYQVRGFAPTGANELLTRRRLTQLLNLSVFDIEPARWRGDDPGARNVLYFDASLRFDTDFGSYMLGRPQGQEAIRELQQSQVDILYAFIGGRRLGGRVDFQLGRQIHFDLVDFYSFDGGSALVRLNRAVAVEAFGGTEVRGEAPLASPVFELDGTSAGSRDPATRPEQNEVLRPLAGGALVLGADGDLPVQARLAYRRMWSATADQLPGEPESGVNDEKVALTASMGLLKRRLFVTGGVRYNLLLAAFDDQQLAVRARASERQWVSVEMVYLAPTFDGDSIWNVFSAGAYRDLRGSYELTLGEGLKLYARGFARHFETSDVEPDTASRWAGGASAGLAWRRVRGMLRGDLYLDDGYGGRKQGVDVSGRWEVRPRKFELEGRLTGYDWRSDQQATDHGFVLGTQVGGRWRLGHNIRLHLLGENNVGTFYVGQYRGLAVVEMDASI